MQFVKTRLGKHWFLSIASLLCFCSLFVCVSCSDDDPAAPDNTTTMFWTPTGVLSADTTVQSVNALAANAAGDIFAGTEIGIFRSQDDGANWTWLSDHVCLSLAVKASEYVFAGTSHGIYRSDDNGDSWGQEKGLSGVGNGDVYAVGVSPNGDVYAGTQDGVRKSVDDGDTWIFCMRNSSGLIQHDIPIYALSFSSSGRVFAASGCYGSWCSEFSRVWYGGNNDCEWGYEGVSSYTHCRALATNAEDHIFVGTGGRGYTGEVYKSTDKGSSFSRLDGLQLDDSFILHALAIGSNGDIFAGVGDAGNGPTEAGAIYRSADGGEKWSKLNAGLTTEHVRSLLVSPNGYIFAGTYSGGVFRSSSAGH
jgi:photosystem II stability/assembly factor-like uncharacterized protein